MIHSDNDNRDKYCVQTFHDFGSLVCKKRISDLVMKESPVYKGQSDLAEPSSYY